MALLGSTRLYYTLPWLQWRSQDIAVANTLPWLQWRSQDIAVARAQHGHTTFVRTSARSAEAYRGSGASSPPPQNCTASQVGSRPYTVAKCKSLTAKLAYDEHIKLDRNSVLYTAMLRSSIPRPFSTRFAINNATISAAPVGHGL